MIDEARRPCRFLGTSRSRAVLAERNPPTAATDAPPIVGHPWPFLSQDGQAEFYSVEYAINTQAVIAASESISQKYEIH